MKKAFRKIRLSPANIEKLATINAIVRQYQAEGYVLTLRQLYYQLVIRNTIPNHPSEYAKLSTLLKEGRMGGLVDWAAIEDRLRSPQRPSFWESPAEILEGVINQYRKDRQAGQKCYV